MIVHVPALPLVVAAFLVGSIPFGVLVGRWFFGTDIRERGSGNIGAANALRTMGRKAGIAVLVLDALKGVCGLALPYWYAWLAVRWVVANHPGDSGYRAELPDLVTPVALACGLAAIVGHCYSPWLRLRGGKGVATFLGVLLVASWESALAFVIVWTAIVLPTGFASLGSIVGALCAILVLALAAGAWTLWFSLPAFALIVWKHKENLGRLYTGTESKLRLLKT